MGPVSLSATVDAPRERVFEFICDISRRPSWTDHFAHDFHLERMEGSGEGAAARFRVNAPRVKFMDTVIAETEAPHKIVERGLGGRGNKITITTVWELSESAGTVTTVDLTFWMDPKGLRGGRWWRRRWRKALRRLGEVIESGEATEPQVRVAGGNRQATGIA